MTDGLIQDAVLRNLQMMVESTKRLSSELKIEGEWAGRVTGLGDQRVEIAVMCTSLNLI